MFWEKDHYFKKHSNRSTHALVIAYIGLAIAVLALYISI